MKAPIILAAAGIALVSILFFAGKTAESKKATPKMAGPAAPSLNIQQFIDSNKRSLTPSQALYVTNLENGITRGDVKEQQVKALESLASFWKDSVNQFETYAFYTAEASKLDNSEKKLTFAARLFLDNLRLEHDEAKLSWKTTEAIELFEKAIAINPGNDDLRIGLGSCYVYGRGRSGDPQETMKGIQELLAVVRKDSTNMKAQFVLGVGGAVSGQYDKAIERLEKVVKNEPANLEAIMFLADTYAAKGEKVEAIKWYNTSKQLLNDPHYIEEVDARIKSLR